MNTQGQSTQNSPKLPITLQNKPSQKLVAPKKMCKYEQNQFSWDQQGLEGTPNSAEIPETPQNLQMIKPKINYLPMANLKDRKFSCNQAFVGYRRRFTIEQPQILPMNTFNALETDEKSFEKTVEDVGEHPLEVHPPQEEPQSYFNKKMRQLQAKFKKCILQYETQLFKQREQIKTVNNQLLFYKKYLQKHEPKLESLICMEFLKEDNQVDLLSDSSSNSKKKQSEEIAMPVNAQILQIKIQGKKWFEKIRCLEAELKRVNEASKIKEVYSNMAAEAAEVVRINQSMRKWSLPRGSDRLKKQSFQTTLISQKSQQDFSQDLSASIHSGISRDYSNCEHIAKNPQFQLKYRK